jgi:hypothetical protein
MYTLILTKTLVGLGTYWAIFSQTNLVALTKADIGKTFHNYHGQAENIFLFFKTTSTFYATFYHFVKLSNLFFVAKNLTNAK